MSVDRNQFESAILKFAEEKAKQLNFSVKYVGKDRCKGWGEKFTEFLEQRVGGDCSSVIKFADEHDETKYIEFRHRFSSPCLSINWYAKDITLPCMVNFEFRNTIYVPNCKVYKIDTELHTKGSPIFEEKTVGWFISMVSMYGIKYSDSVYREWLEELNKLLNELNK